MTNLYETAHRVLTLMDLTRLEENDSAENIKTFCYQINRCHDVPYTDAYPAAICVYPKYIPVVKEALKHLDFPVINIASVVNFPSGNAPVDKVVSTMKAAISSGANEIDVVFPWEAYLKGNTVCASQLIDACKTAGGKNIPLKVILETGKLQNNNIIYNASRLAIDAGADFIKTSTGKVKVNATLNAAKSILMAIKDSGTLVCGFKASGGIRTTEDASSYLLLADALMEPKWVSQHFRFGASGLLNDVLAVLTGEVRMKQHDY